MKHTVGISEMKVSDSPDDIIVTYSLGSCIGVSIYDPIACIGGIIHCMLPLSRIDKDRAKREPCMFTDTGVPLMIQTILDMGGAKDRLITKVAGAAQIMDDSNTFKIGERNQVVLRKVLWKNDMLIAADETGGTIARSLFLYMNTGITTIKAKGREYELV